jgi:hypothetical protein
MVEHEASTTRQIDDRNRNRNPGTDFERSDANIRGILLAGVALAAVCVVSMVGLVWFFGHLANRSGGTASATLVLSPEKMPLPSEPRLEGLRQKGTALPFGMPAKEMQKTIEARHAGYGWVDQDKQIVHVPIEDGMKMVAGTMAKPSPPPAPNKQPSDETRLQTERTHPPGPSSSGRIIDK